MAKQLRLSAAAGGLVSNVRPSDLDPVYSAALGSLDEDGVSGVVESRTGLHVFRLIRRLEPRAPAAAQLQASARAELQRRRLDAARAGLLADLRQRTEVATGEPPWTVGGQTFDAELVAALLPEGSPQAAKDALVDQLLLAGEAAERGLATAELEVRLTRDARLRVLEGLFQERRRAFDAALDAGRLRPFYDAQPSLFDTPEKIRLELIFVPQGRDSFATQKRLEARVAALRAGASFAAAAREISTGPGAEDGGDLGLLEAGGWHRLGPAVAAAVPQLEIGAISAPIYCTGRILSREPWLLRGGFAILRVAERQAPQPRSFDEAIEDVRRAYAAQHRRELDEEVQNRILEEAGFEILRLPAVEELVR